MKECIKKIKTAVSQFTVERPLTTLRTAVKNDGNRVPTLEEASEALVFSCLYIKWLGVPIPRHKYFHMVEYCMHSKAIVPLLETLDFTKLAGMEYSLYEAYLSKTTRYSDGVWYTPQPVVDFITHNALKLANHHFPHTQVKYIDFSLGSGIFGNTLLARGTAPHALQGFDINLTAVMISVILSSRLTTQAVDYRCDDFLDWAQFQRPPIEHIPVFIGNPPYGAHKDFKYPPISDYYVDSLDEYGFPVQRFGGNKGLYHGYKDLYVCFIKASQDIISRAGKGILACITNDSFVIANTFVGMRFSLLNFFDKMYIINLNGSSRKGQGNIKGDRNVFDIMQSVCILICVKNSPPRTLTNHPTCEVYHDSVVGSREHKLNYLATHLDNLIIL